MISMFEDCFLTTTTHIGPSHLTLVKLIKLKRTQTVCTEKERKRERKRKKTERKIKGHKKSSLFFLKVGGFTIHDSFSVFLYHEDVVSDLDVNSHNDIIFGNLFSR